MPAEVERDRTLPVTSDDRRGLGGGDDDGADDWEADRTEAAATAGTREQDIAEVRRGSGKIEPAAVLEASEQARARRTAGDAETLPPTTVPTVPVVISGLESTDPQLRVPPELVSTLPGRSGSKRPKK